MVVMMGLGFDVTNADRDGDPCACLVDFVMGSIGSRMPVSCVLETTCRHDMARSQGQKSWMCVPHRLAR